MLDFLRNRLTYANVMSTVAVCCALGGGAIAATSIPGKDGVIRACYQKKTGKLRVVRSSKQCGRRERRLSWSQRGPAGPPGSQGQPGAPATRLFATITQNSMTASVASGTATSASRARIGEYRVDFNQDVSRCTPVVTLGTNAAAGMGFTDPVRSYEALAGFAPDPATPGALVTANNAVAVRMEKPDNTNTSEDSKFHIAVYC